MWSYVDRLLETPPSERWPLARDWIAREPRSLFAELRTRAPILALTDVTLVARRADVVEVLSLPDVFSAGLYRPKMPGFMLAEDDTGLHTRDKAVMRAMLNRDDLPRIRALVGAIGEQALQQAGDVVEVVSTLSRLVPLRIVQQYFGFVAPDRDMLRWSEAAQTDAFNNLPFSGRPDAEAVAKAAGAAQREAGAALMALIPERLKAIANGDAADDILSRLLRTAFPPSVGFGLPQVAGNVAGLLIGAVETTSQAVVNVLDQLIGKPDLFAAASAAAAEPEIFDGHVWEALRFAPIVPFMFRTAVHDHVLARGTTREAVVPAGTTVLPLTQSAMFDPDWVSDPDAFVPSRPSHDTLHFGYGMHSCLGRYVGGVMIPEIVRQVVLRGLPTRAGPIDLGGTPFPTRYVLDYRAAGPGTS